MPDELTDSRPPGSAIRMPSEWQPHAATWLAWPHNHETWPLNLSRAQAEFLELVRVIAADEPVVLITPERYLDQLIDRIRCRNMADLPISTCNIVTNDAWIRDYGPTFVTQNNRLLGVDWKYNAWGGKYPPFDDDQRVAEQIIQQMPSQLAGSDRPVRIESDLCLEGGAIEIDADGLLLSTLSCALDPHRNSDRTLESIEQELQNRLGATDVIWIAGDAIEGDDTDGHIDQLARFVPGRRIIHAWIADKKDPQFNPLEQNRHDLVTGLRRLGREYELIPLPLPDPVVFEGRRLPASYCNFYITNRSVIVPQFDRMQDRRALDIVAGLFPGRRIQGLPSTHLNVGLGSFHCLTQQQPMLE